MSGKISKKEESAALVITTKMGRIEVEENVLEEMILALSREVFGLQETKRRSRSENIAERFGLETKKNDVAIKQVGEGLHVELALSVKQSSSISSGVFELSRRIEELLQMSVGAPLGELSVQILSIIPGGGAPGLPLN